VSAFVKGGQIDVPGFHALCAPGGMFFDNRWVFFCLTINWFAPAGTDPATVGAYLAASSNALQIVKNALSTKYPDRPRRPHSQGPHGASATSCSASMTLLPAIASDSRSFTALHQSLLLFLVQLLLFLLLFVEPEYFYLLARQFV
jgi:hypothetical protein